MTYEVSGLIQASDYNGFIALNPDNVNNIWSTGSNNKGYGQTIISQVGSGQQILASTQADIVQKTTLSAAHQGTTIGSWRDLSPINGSTIFYEPNLLNNITAITNGRLNAVGQGSISTSSSTNGTPWSNTLTFTSTVTFGSHNQARYFFNAGGQIGFNFSHPAGTSINTDINQLCLDAGTVYVSSPTTGSAIIVGNPYTGVTKVGGGNPSGQIINTNYGFYAFTPTLTEIFRQTTTGTYYYYYGGIFVSISASYNGAGVLTFSCLFDNVGGGYYYGGSITAGTQANIILRPPSTTYLSNVWGSPTIGTTIVTT